MQNHRWLRPLGRSARVALICAAVVPVLAVTYVSSHDGDWATPATWMPNGVPGATDTVQIIHAVTMATGQSVCAIDITASGSLTPGPGVNLNVSGDWNNDGTFNEGTSSVTFTDSTYMSGSGVHRFYDVNILLFLKVPRAEMTVNGTWNCTGEFRHNAGRMIFGGSPVITNGQYFFRVDINSTTGGNVVLVGDICVGDTLRVINGTFLLGENTLILGGTARNCGATVFGPATLSVVGSGPGATGIVHAMLPRYPYSLTVLPGATIVARYAEFSDMDSFGIVVSDGAHVDTVNDFSECAFDHGEVATGPILKIENDQALDMENVSFTATGGYNIEKLGAAGHVLVHGGAGNYWGENFDNDPNDLVDWEVGAVEEEPGAGLAAAGVATVVRGVLFLPMSGDVSRAAGWLLDAGGRRVMVLKPGSNDVRRLSPGVYFVRREGDSRSNKVLLQH